MSSQNPLILAVDDLAYSGGEMLDLIRLCLEKVGYPADLQTVPLADVLESAAHLQPAVILIGYRPLLDDHAMRKRWEAAGSPMGGDIIKALKSNADTRDIPVLLVEGLVHIKRVAAESGADGYVRLPCSPTEIVGAMRALAEREPSAS